MRSEASAAGAARPAAPSPGEARRATVAGLVEARAAACPGAVAVVDGGSRLTYRQLDRRANRLAHHLCRAGVGPEVPVGVALERSAGLVVSLLAILKAGGAYVPLDPRDPEERLRWMMESSGMPVLLTERRLLRRLPSTRSRVMMLDGARLSGAPEVPPAVELLADHLAYVCYTSGSTGRPKGVAVPHRAVVRLVERPDWVELGAADVVLQLAPISFDAATFEIWGALTHGARLVIFPPGVPTLAELGRFLSTHGVTTLWLTAGLFHQMVDRHGDDLGELRQLLAGGDVLSPVHVRSARARLTRGRVINGYGPTENTTFTCCHAVGPQEELEGTVPIGRPVTGTFVDLVDAELEPVAEGEAGELITGGDGLARGYYGRPGLTAERFLPDPLGRSPGARIYRTGDLARRRPDGVYLFLGRRDGQVKIQGHRVEPGEVEVALMEHPAVQRAAVASRTTSSGERQLVAWVVAAGDGPAAAELRGELRRFLGRRLPEFMIPAAFVFLDELPLGPTGKVDRRALPPPPPQRPELSQPYVPAATEAERSVEAVWKELLELDRVGVLDDLFELGGHSLIATRLVARLEEIHGVELPMDAVLGEPTVAAMAARLEAALEAGTGAAPEPPPRSAGGEIPLSFSQQRVWFLERLQPGNVAYNFQALARLSGDLRVEALEQALRGLVARHEILRTSFPQRRGRPVQRIHPPPQVRPPVVDLSALRRQARHRVAAAVVEALIRRPFDLSRLPLIRWVLLRLGPRRHWLLHLEHHLLHDGWSFNLLLAEVAERYRAAVAGRPPVPAAAPWQFADFTLWQQRWMEGEAARRQLAYWRRRLTPPPPPVELPYDRPRPATQSFRGTSFRVELPAELMSDLESLGRRCGASRFMTLLAVFSTLLHRSSGQVDLAVGCGVANRRHRSSESLIGMVINMVVLRQDLGGDPGFADFLARSRQATLEAWAHQDLPFEKVVEAVQPHRQASHNPFFQVAFSFHDAPMEDLELPGLELEVEVGLPNGSAKFDLNVIGLLPPAGSRCGGGAEPVTLLWEYNTDLFDATTMRRLVGHYRNLLEAVRRHPESSLSRLELLSPAERHQLLVEWSDTAAELPWGRPVHELVEEQARRAPEAPAVVAGERVLTYGELVRRAGRLAHRLHRLGVGPESRVVVFAERSPELVLAQLAVLLAGGAYVPVDPAYPAARIRFVLEDAGAAAVMTVPSLRRRLAAVAPPALTILEVAPGSSAEAGPAGGAGDSTAAEGGEERRAVDLDHLAYVIYTSGSTGQPKATELAHRGLLHLVAWHRRTYGVRACDRATLVAGVGFDASVWEIWPYLSAGASLHIPPPEVVVSPRELLAWMARRGITLSFLPTPLAEAVLAVPPPAEPALRALLTGGDRLHARPSPALPFPLINHYGPTESTVVATAAPVVPGPGGGPPPIGRPVDNLAARVVDGNLQPVPVGVVGELVLGGCALTRGYRGRPGLTAERLVPDPLRDRPGQRLYRTGDAARWTAEGTLEFVGRLDHQLKVDGYRIEPGEIEAALRSHPGIAEAVVGAHDGSGGSRRLVAWAVPARSASPPTSAELRQHLAQRLPAYMLPSAFVPLERLPLTAHGKVDRRALPPPGPARPHLGSAYGAPSTEVEKILARAWEQALGLSRVGVHDNFFELGGTSLLLAQIHSELEGSLGREVRMVRLLEHPTIASLAAHLSREEDGSPTALEAARERGRRQRRALRRRRPGSGGEGGRS